jgi:hypothetical protein
MDTLNISKMTSILITISTTCNPRLDLLIAKSTGNDPKAFELQADTCVLLNQKDGTASRSDNCQAIQ